MNLDEVLSRIDANALGEFLRAVAFPEHGKGEHGNWQTGCYTTFEFPKKSELMNEREREEYWYSVENSGPPYDEALDNSKEWAEMGSGCRFSLDNHTIECCYFWDGDGTLSFKVYRSIQLMAPRKLLAAIINTDCKKPHEWENLSEYQKKSTLI